MLSPSIQETNMSIKEIEAAILFRLNGGCETAHYATQGLKQRFLDSQR